MQILRFSGSFRLEPASIPVIENALRTGKRSPVATEKDIRKAFDEQNIETALPDSVELVFHSVDTSTNKNSLLVDLIDAYSKTAPELAKGLKKLLADKAANPVQDFVTIRSKDSGLSTYTERSVKEDMYRFAQRTVALAKEFASLVSPKYE